MAEIHILPLPPAASCDDRTETTLLRAVEAGVDLGARGHHIRALGHSLEDTARKLRLAAQLLANNADPQAAKWQSVQANLDQLTLTIERLTSARDAFPV